jgi:5-methylcytosine-specific restriction enzyme subunit McrC
MIEEGKNAEEQVLTMGFSKGYGTVIRAKSHVGIIRTSDGTTIEILPKINGNALDSETGRNTVRDIFLKMLRTLKDSKYKDFPNVSLKLLDFPVLEIYIFIFLEEVGKLVKKGIKKNYVGREGNLLFLK